MVFILPFFEVISSKSRIFKEICVIFLFLSKIFILKSKHYQCLYGGLKELMAVIQIYPL